MRRWSDGRFRTAAPLSDVPLFEAAVRRKCERVAKGNRTRRLLQMMRAREAMERALGSAVFYHAPTAAENGR